MRNILLAIIIVFVSAYSYAQVQESWVTRTRWSSESFFDAANDVVVDNAGNVYVVGTIEDGDSFIDEDDPDGMVTIKYDKNGNLLWKTLFRRVQLEGSSIAIDQIGNVYVMGFQYFRGSGESVRTDFVTIKYNSNGVQQWQRSYNGPNSRGKTGYLGLDAANNVYIAGTSMGEEDNDSEEPLQPDYAIIKYDNNGNQLWVKRYNGAALANRIDELRGMIVDPAGNIYVTGTSQKDGRISTTTIKYGTDGTEIWVRRNNKTSISIDEGNEITYDLKGNIYVAGGYKDGPNFGFETIKYSNNGEQLWTSYYVIPGSYFGKATSLVVDNSENCYIVGFSRNGNDDLKVIKYNNAGAEQWISTYNASPPSSLLGVLFQYEDFIANIALGADANLYIATTVRNNFLTIKYNSSTGALIWEKEYNGPESAYNTDNARSIWLDALDNVYVTGTSNAGTVGRFDMTTIKYSQCTLTCPGTIEVNTDPGQCGTIVNYTVTTTGDCGELEYPSINGVSWAPGNFFNAGHYYTTVKSPNTGETCRFTIYVNDNEFPVITYCPPNRTVNVETGVCYASAATVNAGIATATDNCSVTVTGTRSDGLALTANYPVGSTTITWKARDEQANTVTCTQTITVVDNVPPEISNVSLSKAVLAPPNHKMIDVTVDYTVADNCSATVTVSVTSDEPESGLSHGDQGPDIVKIDDHHWQLRAERDGKGDGRVYTIAITAVDPSNNTTTETRTVVVAHNIGSPHSGTAVKVGSTVNFAGTFWDVAGSKHTAQWVIDDKTAVKGIVAEPSGMKNGTVTGSYKFTSPGVYKLKMNITDQKGVTTTTSTNGDLEAIVVVYDPNGGYIYGGGYYSSPAGALKNNPNIRGDVGYGFSVNYFKTATNPKGETQFELKAGNLEFNAVNFDYLAVSGAKAQFKGMGRITGDQSGYGFVMTVIDGQLDGSGTDKVRVKIYNKNTGVVVYDDQPGASDAADPVTAVGTNSVITISNTGIRTKSASDAMVTEVAAQLEVTAMPNPSKTSFNLKLRSSSAEKIKMYVMDVHGRTIEERNVVADRVITLGSDYRPGTYIVKLVQGTEYKQVKLVKLPD